MSNRKEICCAFFLERAILSGCEFDEPIMVTALRKCEDNSFPKACGDKWKERPNDCSSPVLKEVVDYAFQGACFLHDLCYLSPYTKKNDCDDWFHYNMKQMCSIRKITRSPCEIGANFIYSTVSKLGKCNFDLAKRWTEQNCTECPRNIRMICPTEEKHFVVHSSLNKNRQGQEACEFDEPIMVTALRECNNSVMDECRDRWEKKPNNCSAPVFKEVVDKAFQGACFLHDLCYLSRNTEQEDCDDWFLHNMKQMCSIQVKCSALSLCNATANTMHLAVEKFGRSKFSDAKEWTDENCIAESTPTKGPTSEDFGSGKGLGSGSGSGRPVLPDEQSTEQTDLEPPDENSPKPEQTEPTQSPKQN